MARLSRAGVSVDAELLEKYDQFIAALGFTNRSEALRRMIREELARSDTTAAGRGVVGVVTLVWSRRALLMRIAPARLDPDSGCNVLATVHVCLDHSTVDHLRWDLRAIFELAVEEGGLTRNPAKLLQTPRSASVAPKRVMTSEEVVRYLSVLEFRERLIAKLAIFAGMRPGEIFGLKWGCIKNGAAKIQRRIYRGREDSPKTPRSVRVAGLTPGIVADLDRWRTFSRDSGPDAWVFPSERLTTPLSKDNCWRRCMEPKLRKVGLAWANFQVMRRTLPSLGREQGADPKVVADQLGHGLGVSLDVYTQADLAQKAATVTRLGNAILQ